MGQINSIYLAGPIQAEVDGGLDWRQKLKEKLLEQNIAGRIPQDLNEEQELPPEEWSALRKQEPDKFRKLFMEKIVKPDINQGVRYSSAVLVYWNGKSTSGTHAEATFAALNHIPVFILLADTPEENIPLWLFGCSTDVFHSTDELMSYLRGWNAAVKRGEE